jgi:hypothetical protein
LPHQQIQKNEDGRRTRRKQIQNGTTILQFLTVGCFVISRRAKPRDSHAQHKLFNHVLTCQSRVGKHDHDDGTTIR